MHQGCLLVGGYYDKPRVIIYVTLDESLKKPNFFSSVEQSSNSCPPSFYDIAAKIKNANLIKEICRS